MKHINLNRYSMSKVKRLFKSMRKQIFNLQTQNKELNDSLNMTKDSHVSAFNLIHQQKEQIEDLTRQLNIAKQNEYKAQTIANVPALNPPKNIGVYSVLTVIKVQKGMHYVIKASCDHTNALYLTGDPHYTSTELNAPYNDLGNMTPYVKFVGVNNQNGSTDIRLEFVPLYTGFLYIVPNSWIPVHNFQVVMKYFPNQAPKWPSKKTIPLPSLTNQDKGMKVDTRVLSWLEGLCSAVKNRRVTISNLVNTQDENGNVSYQFTANKAHHHYTFTQAVDMLNINCGIVREGWNKDMWVAMDSNQNLIKKYLGNDEIFPYAPSKEDINAKDWYVTKVAPFNPNTQPTGSDPRDDSADTSKTSGQFGQDGGPYSDFENENFIDNNDA